MCGAVAQAQQPRKSYRIGVLRAGSALVDKSLTDAFREGLRELGYVEGKNIVIEYRYAGGKRDRWPDIAADMVGLKPDVIVVGGTGLTAVVKQATSTIPIVVGGAGDLLRTGLVSSLARPGGNVTGSTAIAPDLSGKRLELLKEVVPKVSQVAVLWYPLPGSTDDDEIKETEIVARAFRIKMQVVGARAPDEFQEAFAAMKREKTDALIIIQGSFTRFHRRQLAELAAKNRLASMCEAPDFAADGCLMSYGPDSLHFWRRAATFVDKILKGSKPSDIPVEGPKKFEFVINLMTAKQIGLTIPPNVLARADKVIK
jgi:putative ABC transport system substrate-binding protein